MHFFVRDLFMGDGEGNIVFYFTFGKYLYYWFAKIYYYNQGSTEPSA